MTLTPRDQNELKVKRGTFMFINTIFILVELHGWTHGLPLFQVP